MKIGSLIPQGKGRLAAIALALAGACVVVWLWPRQKDVSGLRSPQAAIPDQPGPPVAAPRGADPARRLEALLATLRQGVPSETARLTLDELRTVLGGMAPRDAAAWIRQVLDSRQDAATGLAFSVGPDGTLRTPSSLRVALLDALGRTDPQAAADCARTVLGRMDSPDEWAVSLRNVARADSRGEDRAYLLDKMGQMLRHEPWQANPSTGFLEAFDVAVHLGGTNLVPALADLVRKKDNQPVAHAAYLALDRLTLRDAAPLLRLLQEDPSLMAGREATRANYFARADVRDPQQRQVVESYLLNPALGAVELEKFAGLYPNANFMVSHNLLTKTETPTGAQLAARDAAALEVVREWLADERFAGRRPHLETIRGRLQAFVDQAK